MLKICDFVVYEKIQNCKGLEKKFSMAHFDDLRQSNHSNNRLSKDSNGTKSRKKSSAHIRLINDLNKLTSPSAEKDSGIHLLPPPPPPPPPLLLTFQN